MDGGAEMLSIAGEGQESLVGFYQLLEEKEVERGHAIQ